MDSNKFREFVIKSAQKYILESEELDEKTKILAQPKPPKLTKHSFTKRGVNEVPKEPKTPEAPEPVSIATVKESCSPEKIKMLAEEMKKVNKKIDLRNPLINPDLFDIILKEDIDVDKNPERWKNLYNYEIPGDELR